MSSKKQKVDLNQSFHDTVAALAQDMPLLMHGAGDSAQPDPESAVWLSTLTVQYITNLVDAALDAHRMLQDGDRKGTAFPPPPPRKRKLPGKSDWVGATGVDLRESRIRSAYVRGTAALSTSAFLFPICHDGYVYGKVTSLLQAQRLMTPVLLDPVLTDVVQTEASEPTAKKQKEGEDDDGEEKSDQEEEEDEETGPAWPGLDNFLPIHRTSGLK